jgi:hypothetical protein
MASDSPGLVERALEATVASAEGGRVALFTADPVNLRPDLPPGPVRLYLVVVGSDGRPLGAAPTAAPSYKWADGRLHVDYGPVTVTLRRAGRYAYAAVVATVGEWWRPAFRVNMNPPAGMTEPPWLGAGCTVTVIDALVKMNFDGTPNEL